MREQIGRRFKVRSSSKVLGTFSRPSKLASKSESLGWHHSEVPEINEGWTTLVTLTKLCEQRSNFERYGKSDLKLFSAELYAAAILQSLKINSAEEYFEWAQSQLNNNPYDFPEYGVENLFHGEDVHRSKEFHQFIDDAVSNLDNGRLIIPWH